MIVCFIQKRFSSVGLHSSSTVLLKHYVFEAVSFFLTQVPTYLVDPLAIAQCQAVAVFNGLSI